MISAAVLDALVAAGASTEMIVAAVKADAREEENKAAEKRAKDAARQRKSRMSRGLSVTSCDSDGHSVTVLSPKEKSPAPPKEITPISCSDDQRSSSLSSPQAEDGTADDLFDDGVIDLELRKKTDQDLLRWFGESWNDLAESLGLPQARELTKARQANIRQRAVDLVKIYDFEDPKTGFADVFARIRGSPFLRGESGGFRTGIDFVVNKATFTKIMEGKYEARQQNQAARK